MKKVFVLSLISVGYFLNAQNLSNSPYASYGIGDVKYDNTIETASMGGISTAYVSDFNSSFNFGNPANNANFELTSIKLGATNENNYFKTDYNNMKSTKHSTYLSNISLAFPVSPRVKIGILYQPYSSKSYELINKETQADGSTIYANNFKGTGTLNTAQIAASYKVSDQFSLGARANYYFGNLYDINEFTTSTAELINGYETKNSIKNFNFTLGANYQKIDPRNDHKLTIGATATFGNTSNMTTEYTNSTYYYSSTDVKEDQNIIEQRKTNSNSLLPFEASVGLGYGNDKRWFTSLQVDYKKGESTAYFGKTLDLKDSYRISAGGWYLPNFNNFRSYFSRVIYRYGAFYEKGNLQLLGNNIDKYGVTAGVLLPFKSSSVNRMSGLEIGIEVGKKGTLKDNLIRQNYFNVRFGFNFADKWFRKSLYN